MSVRILLDEPHTFYTNLDFISGRIVLSLNSDENISAIVVKLEGESRTMLMRPMNMPTAVYAQRRARDSVAAENHKILYKVAQVFPNQSQGAGMGQAYTLRAGQHEYPFRLKIPFNNACMDPQPQQPMGLGGLGGLGLTGLQQMQYRHVKRTLPPSLTGFPGEAEVRYYVKVTVQRPSLFKENRRSAIGFRFMPIEPPRPPKTSNESFARRPFQFQAGLGTNTKKTSMFKKKATQLSDVPPQGEVDARLPSPAILTCNEPLPLRLLVRKLNDSPEQVFLMSLQLNLIGYTEVRAMDVSRTETSSWVLMSLNGLTLPIGSPTDAVRTESIIDSKLWDHIPLPNTVAPSFHTCNLTRKYELEVRVGLGYGVPGEVQPQTITLPLHFQVDIFSGIHPPAALLDAIANAPMIPTSTPPTIPARPQDPAYPPQLGTPGALSIDDVPPSYEDAMADGMTPTDGPRREFSGVTDVNAPGMDEKGAAPKYSAHQGSPGPRGGGVGGSSTYSAVV
ncbi:related to arrestin (or S-antigen), N-terminal domain protein [Rhynchosporium agropyri]|uniref:Related to arrestin (Or S-antigen), N-terminal domain protein n=1 Tax=Rhynchosporium agropyri TaxID=914238 RepID=A0A1E1KN00_9HELO|nr:related to arrestin (or S-antigen), N-terminal domain protein [Rhynchosporium agropyri]